MVVKGVKLPASAKTITVVGMGMSPEDLSEKALSVIKKADILVGGKRHLRYFSTLPVQKIPIYKNLKEILKIIDTSAKKNKKVVVIGGGDTGSDCLGTALRQGAIRVSQLEIVPKPSVKRNDNTPWPMWPVLLRQTHAHKEGGDLFWSIMTREFLGEKGAVKKVRCAEVEWVVSDANRPPVPVEKEGTEFEMEADLVILAMGFLGPDKSNLVTELGVELDSQGNVKADHHRMTNLDGIFVAGDMAMGQSLVVRAIADGRKTALGIKTYLR